MGVIEITVFAILLIYIAIKGDNKNKIIAIIGMFALFVISALRHEDVGIDIPGYISTYKSYAKLNYSALLHSFEVSEVNDEIYYISGWLFSRITTIPQWWLAIIACLYSFSVGKLMYKESEQVAISIVMLVALGYYYFSLTGLRQTIAMSIIILSYPFLRDRRLIPFLICVAIACLYHQSALIFLIAYPISNKRLGLWHIIGAVVVFMVFFVFKDWLVGFLESIFQETQYANYTSGNASQLTMAGFAIQSVCFLFALYFYKEMINKSPTSITLYNLCYIGWLFQIFSSFNSILFRISLYFSIFNIVLVANASSCEKDNKSRAILQMVVVLIFVLYMIRDGGIFYQFFWR